MYVFMFLVKVTEWPPIGKIAAHSAYEMFSCYDYHKKIRNYVNSP